MVYPANQPRLPTAPSLLGNSARAVRLKVQCHQTRAHMHPSTLFYVPMALGKHIFTYLLQ
jgi:hypothetical protein